MKKIGQLSSFLLVSLMFVTSCTEPRIEKDESNKSKEKVEIKDLVEEDALVADTIDVEPVATKLPPPPEPIPPVDPIPPGPMPDPDPRPDPIEPIMPPPPPPRIPDDGFQEPEVIQFPDVEAEFPGGTEALMKYIKDHLKYPAEEREMGIQGRVYVEFVVEKNGEVTTVKVIRGVSKNLDLEAKRLVTMMPDWKPAESRGNPVRSKARLPITFTLD